MKKSMKWMVLAVVALVSTSVWAVWNPDTDADLKFNLNIETRSASGTKPPTTTDSVAAFVGTFTDYNTAAGYDVNTAWATNGPEGNYVDFRNGSDKKMWGAPNDCRLSVVKNGNAALNFGVDETTQRTWAFWFWEVDYNEANDVNDMHEELQLLPQRTPPALLIEDATFIRHEDPTTTGKFWDMSLTNSRIKFRCNKADARMSFETLDDVNTMGIKAKTWHHVVFVIDRTTTTSSKIYVDGLEQELNYGAFPGQGTSMNINNIGNSRPLSVGANGSTQLPWRREGEFDGRLDGIRVYHKALQPLQAHILSQWNTFVPHPIALLPIRNSDEVPISTDVNWIRSSATQRLLFGDDPCNWDVNTVVTGGIKGTGDVNDVNNKKLGGPLSINTNYYWRVNSSVGPLWKFTTITGKASAVYPTDGQQKVSPGMINLKWSAPDANAGVGRADYDVYFSTNFQDVNGMTSAIRTGLPNDGDPNCSAAATTPGATYYWRVKSYYPIGGQYANSDVFSFRNAAYPVVFNTGPINAYYTYNAKEQTIAPYQAMAVNPITSTWSIIATGYPVKTGPTIGIVDCCVAVFDFNDFDYNSLFDIIIVPDYDTGNDNTVMPTPLVLDINGSFYFDGTMNIAGDDSDVLNKNASSKSRCGGHRGPRREPDKGVPTLEIAAGFYPQTATVEYETRLGDQRTHNYYIPTTINSKTATIPGGYAVFGPGCSFTAPYKDSGGGGHGGRGGYSGRGWITGLENRGSSYSDEEVPVPFGGSSASWAQTGPGNAGGGGLEIDANCAKYGLKGGNVTFGPHAKIYANGGTTPFATQYPAGGGAGGSIKIVADSNVTIDGFISVAGGDGGDGDEKGNNTGGGGAGGRVAIFYGKNIGPVGYATHIDATGGEKGLVVGSTTYASHNGLGLSSEGEDGTTYIKSYAQVSPRKASAPTPRDGDFMVYAPSTPTALTLKWFSGYNVTPANDTVYCDTNPNPVTPIGNSVPATRGQHSSTTTVAVNPDMTYYMKVKTSRVGMADVYSDTTEFRTVGWQCLNPDWQGATATVLDVNSMWTTGKVSTNSDIAGHPAWDENLDCVVNDLDFWHFAKDWEKNIGGSEYKVDIGQLDQYVSEWMTCRARTNSGCWGWPVTPDWIPASVTQAQ
jgi:hypothetical protein